jgi:hypothetical protein
MLLNLAKHQFEEIGRGCCAEGVGGGMSIEIKISSKPNLNRLDKNTECPKSRSKK